MLEHASLQLDGWFILPIILWDSILKCRAIVLHKSCSSGTYTFSIGMSAIHYSCQTKYRFILGIAQSFDLSRPPVAVWTRTEQYALFIQLSACVRVLFFQDPKTRQACQMSKLGPWIDIWVLWCLSWGKADDLSQVFSFYAAHQFKLMVGSSLKATIGSSPSTAHCSSVTPYL